MPSQGLSKSRIINHRQCPKRLWLQAYRPDLEDEGSEQPAIAAGHRVGALARKLVPGGVLIDTSDLREALRQTAKALADKTRRPLFEATVQHNGVLVQADLLIPHARGWRMVEVKSSSQVKPYYREDAAIQSWVLRSAGVPLTGEGIAYVNNAFVYPGRESYHGLLVESIESDSVAALRPEVPGWIDAARQTLARKTAPRIAAGDQCTQPFSCPFQAHCMPPASGYPVHILPYGSKVTQELEAQGYTDLRDVPKNLLSQPRHLRIWEATRTGKPYVSPVLRKTLQALPYPRVYIDFETINPEIPYWLGTRPYQVIPFQWSCHIEHKGGRLEHLEFLADGRDDPRPAFIRTLLEAVGSTGPILVWSGFEQSRLKEIAEAIPRYASPIRKVIDRMVDLLPLAREHYYHPDMRGSWSIKSVLPTIAPELAYDDLDVADGQQAQEAFRRILLQQESEVQRESVRQALLAYCERDTLAMVRITAKLS